MNELIYASAKTQAQALRDKKISCVELVNAHLSRIEEVNPKLNAMVQLRDDLARKEAISADKAIAQGEELGPLHGVPVTQKDSIEAEGLICTSGTLGRKDFVAPKDGTVLARMRGAGAIFLGLTNVPELAFAFETDNLIYGRTNNPYDLSRTPGGSSGGEAALIASGGSALGNGSDLAGSIRLPSHFCGIAGIKPTHGRVPKTGGFPRNGRVSDYLSTQGPMARFVEDLALVLPIVSGPDFEDPEAVPMPLGNYAEVEIKGLRVAFYTDDGSLTPTKETMAIVKSAAQKISDEGAHVDEARPPDIDQTLRLQGRILGASAGEDKRILLKSIGTTKLSPMLEASINSYSGAQMTYMEFANHIAEVFSWRNNILRFMRDYDVIICPSNASPALPHGGVSGASFLGFGYTMTYNLLGWPGTVVRCGTSPEKLPINVQVVASPGQDHISLAVASFLEKSMGGWQKPPI